VVEHHDGSGGLGLQCAVVHGCGQYSGLDDGADHYFGEKNVRVTFCGWCGLLDLNLLERSTDDWAEVIGFDVSDLYGADRQFAMITWCPLNAVTNERPNWRLHS
jgi:hypothetical protein